MKEVLGLYNYWIVIFLMMTGFYIVIARTNLIQKVIGLNIFQISVFLLYITMGKVTGGTAPILQEHADHHAATSHAVAHVEPQATTEHPVEDHGQTDATVADAATTHATPAHTEEAEHSADSSHTSQDSSAVYSHPLPSVLMLTAIVVGVATTAVALALIIRIGEAYGTIEEDEILQLDRETT